MSETFINALVLVAVVAIVISYILISPRGQNTWKQKLTDRKRQRAHEGKITCESTEDGQCTSIAVRETPNGYACEWHWEPMSVKVLPNGGKTIWNHTLNHAIRVA